MSKLPMTSWWVCLKMGYILDIVSFTGTWWSTMGFCGSYFFQTQPYLLLNKTNHWCSDLLLLTGQEKNRGRYSQQQKDTYLHTFSPSRRIQPMFYQMSREVSDLLRLDPGPVWKGTAQHCSTACGGRTTGPHRWTTSVCRWCFKAGKDENPPRFDRCAMSPPLEFEHLEVEQSSTKRIFAPQPNMCLFVA